MILSRTSGNSSLSRDRKIGRSCSIVASYNNTKIPKINENMSRRTTSEEKETDTAQVHHISQEIARRHIN